MAKVLFTEPAEYDLAKLEYYIAVQLCDEQAAVRIANGIMAQAMKLENFPERHPLLEGERFALLGLRRTSFDNYNIFYYFDEGTNIVYIIRILYNAQDWKSILRS